MIFRPVFSIPAKCEYKYRLKFKKTMIFLVPPSHFAPTELWREGWIPFYTYFTPTGLGIFQTYHECLKILFKLA